MRRKTFDALVATGGLVVAIILAIAGGLGLWAHSFAQSNLHNQLASQQIYFPKAGTPALTANPEIARYVTPYAGQQVTTGKQAEVFADHYIAVHLREIGHGQTYSQVSSQVQALAKSAPSSPQLKALQAEEATLFQGTTLRGMLLNAYAFGVMGQIAFIAALAAFGAAAVLLVFSALGYAHLRRVSPEVEVLPRLGAHTAAPVER